MANSSEFEQLVTRLEKLGQNLLPTFSPTGSYSEAELDRTRGYRLLAHAEIESFLEAICMRCVSEAFAAWQSHNEVRRSLLAVVSHIKSSSGSFEQDLESQQLRNRIPPLEEKIGTCITRYFKLIKDNHGVREKNILAILLPAGVLRGDIDDLWLNTIDTYGRDRGDVAHKSAIQTSIDPKDDFETVNKIQDGLKNLDQEILKLSASTYANLLSKLP